MNCPTLKEVIEGTWQTKHETINVFKFDLHELISTQLNSLNIDISTLVNQFNGKKTSHNYKLMSNSKREIDELLKNLNSKVDEIDYKQMLHQINILSKIVDSVKQSHLNEIKLFK